MITAESRLRHPSNKDKFKINTETCGYFPTSSSFTGTKSTETLLVFHPLGVYFHPPRPLRTHIVVPTAGHLAAKVGRHTRNAELQHAEDEKHPGNSHAYILESEKKKNKQTGGHQYWARSLTRLCNGPSVWPRQSLSPLALWGQLSPGSL